MRLDEHRPPATRPVPFSNTSPATPVGGPLANSVEFPARSTPAPKAPKAPKAPSVASANAEAPAAPKAPKSDKARQFEAELNAAVAEGVPGAAVVRDEWNQRNKTIADYKELSAKLRDVKQGPDIPVKTAEQSLAEKANITPVELTDEERLAAGHARVVKDGQVSWLAPEELEKRKTKVATTDNAQVAPEDIEDPKHAKAVKMFMAGDSMRAIGREVGVSHETARSLLMQYGYVVAQRDKASTAERETGKAYAADETVEIVGAEPESAPLGLDIDPESEASAADMSAEMPDDYSNNDEVVDRDLELGGISMRNRPDSGAAVAATEDIKAKRDAEQELHRRRAADPELYARAGSYLRTKGITRKGDAVRRGLMIKAMDVLSSDTPARKAERTLRDFAMALGGKEYTTKLEAQEAQEEEAAVLAKQTETLDAAVERIVAGDVDAVMAALELLTGENGRTLRRRLVDHFGMPSSYSNEQIIQYFMELHEEAEARMQPLVEEAATLWGEGFDGLTPAQQRAFATDLMNIGDLKYDTRVLRQLREEINGQVGRSEEGGGQVEVGPAAGRDEGRTAEEGAQPDAVSGPGESSKGPVVKVRKRRTLQRGTQDVAPERTTPDDAPTTSARRIEPLTGSRAFVRAMVGLRSNLPKSPTLDADLRENLVAGDIKGALDAIAAGGSSVAARQLAKKLSALMTDAVQVEVVEPGKYYPEGVPNILASAYGVAELDRDNKRVTIYLRSDVGVNEETVLHEALHAALQSRYDFFGYGATDGKAGAAALAQFNETWKAFQAEVSRATGELPIGVREAARSPDEFITYALTNPETQAWMQSRRYRGRTLWERFKNFVASALGFRSAPNWLDAAMRVSDEVLEGAAQDKADFSASEALAGRTAVSPQLIEIADRYGPTAAKAVTDTSSIMRKAGDSMLFLHDLVDKYKGQLPSAGAAKQFSTL
ncbi:MAG: hypothetical protein PHI64_19135 [Zoogloea sp.]|uniref:hypothetical protein n=1 Tax=Zoogloea sp. TaxID=49181 RepID=UPI00260DCE4C|nr:hypothetical protein [Zoogloea sp.]MDD2991054.1 hypothetical protein [Zoogloea sp.]